MSSKKAALGRGFESLIPTELFDEEFDPTQKEDLRISSLMELPLDKVVADPEQPRKNFDDGALANLAASIKLHGVLQPIVVVKKGNSYQIVAGERRFRASKLAGKTTIPAIVRNMSDQNRLELSLIENIQRSNLSIIEVAVSYMKLRDQFNLSLAEIGDRVGGKSVAAISNTLRLLQLPKAVVQALDQNRLTEGQVRALIGLDNKLVLELAEQIEKQGLSARQVESLVRKIKQQAGGLKPKKAMQDASVLNLSKIMSEKLSTKVTVKANSKLGGKIEIAFKNEADLDRLKSLLIK